MILGVTGGIASGKSTVAKMLQELGATVVSADELARDLVLPGTPVLQQLVERFGLGILAADGTLERKKLGEVVFADADARKDLEAIMHPAIAELSTERLRQAVKQQDALWHEVEKPGGGLVVYEAPLLYEAGAESRVDKVLTVTVAEEVQLQRLQLRDKCSNAEAQKRIAAQMPQKEKAQRANYVIDNSQGIVELQHRVDALYQKLFYGQLICDNPSG